MTCLSTIAPKLAKLIPLLSSDKPGEVTATAAAIDRTLKGAGLSWHDLASRIASTPAPFVYQPAPADAYSRPAPSNPARKPSPWPTYTTLRQSERIAWLDAIERGPHSLEKGPRFEFAELRRKMIQRPHELLSRKEINFFTCLVRTSWILGMRI